MAYSRKLKEKFIQKLDEAKGIVAYACSSTGIARRTYYNWIKEDEWFREACEDITEMVKDIVEAKLLTNINEGKETSVIFYLKTKAKDRGYVERQEIEHSMQLVEDTVHLELKSNNIRKAIEQKRLEAEKRKSKKITIKAK
ncbi:MAG: hypothetical protein KC589_09330 [Nanoarchaeota archaeon]|nr:hypothetical protein [Nanoarchaeota archaeon]